MDIFDWLPVAAIVVMIKMTLLVIWYVLIPALSKRITFQAGQKED